MVDMPRLLEGTGSLTGGHTELVLWPLALASFCR